MASRGKGADWPPPVRARVRSETGVEAKVMKHHHKPSGDFVVIRRELPGGWELRPLWRDDWIAEGFTVVESAS